MTTSYLPYDPQQQFLLPHALQDWLPEGHLAYFISDTVDSLDLSALPDALATSAASYLSRYWQLNSAPRDALGQQLAADVAARVSPPPPPGLAPAAYLHTVLAERCTGCELCLPK